MKINVLVFLFISICSGLVSDLNWSNEHFTRTIDLKKSYIKETVLIEARNIGSSPASEYYFSLPDGINVMGNVSLFGALYEDKQVMNHDVENGVYKLKLPVPLAPNSKLNLRVQYAYTNKLTPVPSEISLSDVQALLVKINKYNYSPYETDDFSLVIEGINKAHEVEIVEDVDENANVEVPEMKGETSERILKFGPVDGVKPWSVKPLGLLYDHNKPLGKVHLLQRGIWLPSSDINEFQIEEYYELYNAGAELKDGFSRLEWLKGRYETVRNHWGLSHLEFPMNDDLEFDDYYFTDKVGMVTTHKKVKNFLLFEPRFPLFGGWKYNFTFGFNQKFNNHLRKIDDETYLLKIPLLNSPLDLTYDNVELSFYLPENAEFVNISSPISFTSIENGFEKSYLDVSDGHRKVTVVFNQLFEDLRKIDVYVMYKYTKINYWWKVVKISGFVFAGLISYYLVSLIDLSIKVKK